jgi:hypothetical protein
LNFIVRFSKQKYTNLKITWKSIQWKPSCSMREDGRTDRRNIYRRTDVTILTVGFRNFANAPKTHIILVCCFNKGFLTTFVKLYFKKIFCHPKQMSHANALCSLTSYEPWTKKYVLPAAGGGWNHICSVHVLSENTGRHKALTNIGADCLPLKSNSSSNLKIYMLLYIREGVL